MSCWKTRVWLWTFLSMLLRIIGILSVEGIHNEVDHPLPLPVENQVVPQFIIDCDPAGMIATGLDVDDDLALLNAIKLHQQGSIRIVGITITGGNAPIDFTYINALELIRRRAGLHESDIGIYKGGLPLSKGTWLSSTGTTTTTSIANTSSTHMTSDASLFIVETIMNAPEQSITVLCIGPLTNIAAAYTIEPRIAHRVQRIVSMGGTLSPNFPQDLNIRTDPIAASIVWNDMECPKIILPIEICVQAVFGPPQLKHVEQTCFGKNDDDSTTSTRSLQSSIICSYWTRLTVQRHIMPWLVNRRYTGMPGQQVSTHIADGFILWDLVALWAAIRPDLFNNWTYWEVKPLTYQKSSFFTRQGLGFRFNMVDFSETITPNDQQWNRHRVLVPMTLTSENELLELVMNHLFLHDESSVIVSEPLLSFYQSLGTLPRYFYTAATLVISSVLCFTCFRRWVR